MSATVPQDTASEPLGAVPEDDARPAPRARRQNVTAALVLLAVGAVAAVLSWRLGIGDLSDPGPGLWPLTVAVAVVVVSAVLLLQPRPTGEEEPFTGETRLVLAGAASLLAYAALFERVGFELPTVALLVLWLRVLGREGWVVSVAVALGATTAVHLLFVTGLGVSLPRVVHF